MADVIITNFSRNFTGKTFPKYGVRALYDIVKKDVSMTNTIAQMTMMVHASKADLSAADAAGLYKAVSKMCVKEVSHYSTQDKEWESLATKVVNHPQVILVKIHFSSRGLRLRIFRLLTLSTH